MTVQILEIIDKIYSSSPQSLTVQEIVKEFQQSAFFRSVLPDFTDKVTEQSSVR